MKNYPIIYRTYCSTCGAISILPLDIFQSKIISNKPITIKLSELKWISLVSLIFVTQYTIYNSTHFINNQSIRGLLAGLGASPIYIILEIKKYYSRFEIHPVYKNIIIWLTLREICFYITIYSFYNYDFKYIKFVSIIAANTIGFPLKMLALKKSYKKININKKTIKKLACIEIFKSSIGDSITYFLINNYELKKLL